MALALKHARPPADEGAYLRLEDATAAPAHGEGAPSVPDPSAPLTPSSSPVAGRHTHAAPPCKEAAAAEPGAETVSTSHV